MSTDETIVLPPVPSNWGSGGNQTRGPQYTRIVEESVTFEDFQTSLNQGKSFADTLFAQGIVLTKVKQDFEFKGSKFAQNAFSLGLTVQPASSQETDADWGDDGNDGDDKKQFYQEWWFWVLTGFVILMLGIVSWALLKGESQTETQQSEQMAVLQQLTDEEKSLREQMIQEQKDRVAQEKADKEAAEKEKEALEQKEKEEKEQAEKEQAEKEAAEKEAQAEKEAAEKAQADKEAAEKEAAAAEAARGNITLEANAPSESTIEYTVNGRTKTENFMGKWVQSYPAKDINGTVKIVITGEDDAKDVSCTIYDKRETVSTGSPTSLDNTASCVYKVG